MGNLTKNLSRSEFACRCGCGFDTADVVLVPVLQQCADHFAAVDGCNVRIKITGPNRCLAHNEMVQKEAKPNYIPFTSKSQHLYARAVDFKLFNRDTGDQIDPDRVADYLDDTYPASFGIGRYSNRTHFDTRTNDPARWDVRS